MRVTYERRVEFMLRSGLTKEEIAEKLNVPLLFVESNAFEKKRNKAKAESIIVKLYLLGIDRAYLRDEFNITNNVITNLLNGFGCKATDKINKLEFSKFKKLIKNETINENNCVEYNMDIEMFNQYKNIINSYEHSELSMSELYTMYKNGVSLDDILEATNVNQEDIMNYIEKHNKRVKQKESKKKCHTERNKLIAEMYNNGKSIASICKQFKVGDGTVNKVIREYNCTIRENKFACKELSKEDKENIVNEVMSSNEKLSAICRKYSISVATLYRYASELGYNLKDRDRDKFESEYKEIVRLRNKGMVAREIGDQLGISMTTIYRRLKEGK